MKDFLKYCIDNKTIITPEVSDGEGWFFGANARFSALAASYFVSANILIETGLNDECENFITAPAIYLYRHAVELSLKEILSYLGVSKFKHSIDSLYYQLCDELIKHGYTSVPDETVFFSIMQFHSISPTSTEFRYDNQMEKSESLLGGCHMLFCNLRNAQYHAKIVEDYYRHAVKEIKKRPGLKE